MHDPQPNTAPTRARAATLRSVSFVTLLVLAAVGGLRAATLRESADSGGSEALLAAALALVSAWWCLYDGRMHGRPVPAGLLMIVLIVLPVGLPLYFLWSRGLSGLLFVLAFVGSAAVVWSATEFLTDLFLHW